MSKALMEAFGGSNVAQLLLNNDMNVNALRLDADVVANGTLRKDEWKAIDDAVLEVAQIRLVGVADLLSRGLRLGVGNGSLSATVLEWEDVSDMNVAQISMDGITPGENSRVEYDLKFLPLPIYHKDFQITLRTLNNSRSRGASLDATQARLSSEKVAQLQEQVLFQGAGGYTFGGGTLYGYVDFPQRNTVTLATDWDASAKTGEEILDDVKALKQANIDAKHYGPYVLYIPTAYETVLDCDFKADSDKSIAQRLAEVRGIEAIKVADQLPANNVVLVQMTEDTVRQVEEVPLTTVQWDSHGGMLNNFKVMTVSVSQIRSDQEGQSGVAHLSA